MFQKESCKFEWVFCQRKYGSPRFSGAESRLPYAEMTKKPPKLQLKEFSKYILMRLCSDYRVGAAAV